MPRWTNVAMRSRWRRASSSAARAWRTSAVSSRFDRVVVADRVEAQPRARLLQRRLGLAMTSSKSVGVRRAMHLARAPGSEIDEQLVEPPVTLRLSITCSSAASVPVTVIDRDSDRFSIRTAEPCLGSLPVPARGAAEDAPQHPVAASARSTMQVGSHVT